MLKTRRLRYHSGADGSYLNIHWPIDLVAAYSDCIELSGCLMPRANQAKSAYLLLSEARASEGDLGRKLVGYGAKCSALGIAECAD